MMKRDDLGLPTAAEQAELVRRIQSGDAASALAARNELALRHIGLVKFFVRKLRRADDDLEQEGFLGLLEAAQTYDPDKGKFSTYAWYGIRLHVFRAFSLDSTVQLPNHLHHADGPRGEGRLARECWAKCLQARMPTATLSEDADLVDEHAIDPAAALTDQDDRERIVLALAELPPILKEILARRAGVEGREPQSIKAIARALDLSEPMTRKLEVRALEQIARRLGYSCAPRAIVSLSTGKKKRRNPAPADERITLDSAI
jgi:RNA polymerase sigma factor (sigma-70 family)